MAYYIGDVDMTKKAKFFLLYTVEEDPVCIQLASHRLSKAHIIKWKSEINSQQNIHSMAFETYWNHHYPELYSIIEKGGLGRMAGIEYEIQPCPTLKFACRRAGVSKTLVGREH
jgi:hypothetical protein